MVHGDEGSSGAGAGSPCWSKKKGLGSSGTEDGATQIALVRRLHRGGRGSLAAWEVLPPEEETSTRQRYRYRHAKGTTTVSRTKRRRLCLGWQA